MPFETFGGATRRVAVIGGGISGLGAAHLLSKTHSVVLFEAEKRLGGHARTVIAGRNGDQPVDTGFIVFNRVNYPNLVRLFEDLDVPVAESNMSFGASFDGGRFEYALRDVNALTAQRSNVLRPGYLRMLRDILKFNRDAPRLADDPNLTIRGLLERLGTGRWFCDYYILPFSGAIWSTPKHKVLDFPAQTLVRFFENHALMSNSGQHQWFTVKGGSVEYVRRLANSLEHSGVELRTGTSVSAVQRMRGGVLIKTPGGEWEPFDDVVFATHSDITLGILSDASPVEARALGAVRFQPNEAVLHADASLMPKRRPCWSSWNYTEGAEPAAEDRVDLTYWMNSLQPIPNDDPMFVTLNNTRRIREDLIYDIVQFDHPVYDLDAQWGREKLARLQGQQNTWFCGAWMKNGFHEDGLSSSVDVVAAMADRYALPIAAQ